MLQVVDGVRRRDVDGLVARIVGRLLEHRLELGRELLLELLERDLVLRAARPGERRLDGREVELERVAEERLRHVGRVEEPLLLGVRLDEIDLILRASGEAEVRERLDVDREEADRRAVLGRHVGDRRAIGQRERGHAGAVELDELADDLLLPEHLGDGEHEVGRGRALGELALELEADDLGDEHRERLAEHRRLGLDAADAPADDAEPVDHRGVRVGADERVGVGHRALAAHDDAAEELEVHLVADADVGRDDAEVGERLRAPTEKRVALAVPRELELGVLVEGVDAAELVDLDRVIDDEIGRLERVDPVRIAAELDEGLAHRRHVDDRRDAGEVLEQDAAGVKGDLLVGCRLRIPLEERVDVLALDDAAVLVTEQIFEEDAERERELAGRGAERGQTAEAVDAVSRAGNRELPLRAEAIRRHACLLEFCPEGAPCRGTMGARKGRRRRGGASGARLVS